MEKENELATLIVDVCFKTHKAYGPGLLESVYEQIMAYELRKRRLRIEVQKCISLVHEELYVPNAFRADIIVENCVLIELKSAETLSGVYFKQVLTYLKVTGLRLGILVNFNEELIKNGIERVINKH